MHVGTSLCPRTIPCRENLPVIRQNVAGPCGRFPAIFVASSDGGGWGSCYPRNVGPDFWEASRLRKPSHRDPRDHVGGAHSGLVTCETKGYVPSKMPQEGPRKRPPRKRSLRRAKWLRGHRSPRWRALVCPPTAFRPTAFRSAPPNASSCSGRAIRAPWRSRGLGIPMGPGKE